jgi:hypothetical protein
VCADFTSVIYQQPNTRRNKTRIRIRKKRVNAPFPRARLNDLIDKLYRILELDVFLDLALFTQKKERAISVITSRGCWSRLSRTFSRSVFTLRSGSVSVHFVLSESAIDLHIRFIELLRLILHLKILKINAIPA